MKLLTVRYLSKHAVQPRGENYENVIVFYEKQNSEGCIGDSVGP